MGETEKQTRLLAVRDLHRDRAAIDAAARLLRAGELAVIPTETVYGLGANALDPSAVAKIFKAKGRPQDNPLIVHITSLDEAEPLAGELPSGFGALAGRFWPGPLTIVLPRSARVPPVVSAGLDTVAVRMPSHPVARAVIRAAGVPVAAPSANLSGSPSPTSARHCFEELRGKVELVLDGGDCEVGLESTVLSLTGERPRLLRPGAVTPADLEAVLGPVEIDDAVTHQLKEGAAAASPGMKYRHYAPRTPLTLVHGPQELFIPWVRAQGNAAALVFDEDVPSLAAIPCVAYGGRTDPAEQGRRLFAALRELDGLGREQAFARAPSVEGMGLAVYNRLLRAAGFSEIFL